MDLRAVIATAVGLQNPCCPDRCRARVPTTLIEEEVSGDPAGSSGFVHLSWRRTWIVSVAPGSRAIPPRYAYRLLHRGNRSGIPVADFPLRLPPRRCRCPPQERRFLLKGPPTDQRPGHSGRIALHDQRLFFPPDPGFSPVLMSVTALDSSV